MKESKVKSLLRSEILSEGNWEEQESYINGRRKSVVLIVKNEVVKGVFVGG